MKIVLLSGASSIHTIRWANGLKDAGHQVHVITQHPPLEPFNDGVVVHKFPFRGVPGYYLMVRAVRRLLNQIQPDIVNAHYASGYGTTARLVNWHPWVLSVWGSDVYDFPEKSPVHRLLVRRNLEAADRVASTSRCMAVQTKKHAPKLSDIAITPFGVDLSEYSRLDRRLTAPGESVVIGTVKVMADKYGIDTLIEAFARLRERLQETPNSLADSLVLRIVGDGPKMKQLQKLAQRLGIADTVTFVGRVPHAEVPSELAKLDVYVALSRLESFGVAVIEAGAAGCPVVVSDAGGLPEVTVDGKTGLVVPRDNPEAAAEAIETLVRNPLLREQMGGAGRRHVQDNYSWEMCIDRMLLLYSSTIQNQRKPV